MREYLFGLCLLWLGVAAAIAGPPARAGVVWYVDAAAPPGGDGAHWSTAFADLQHALALAGQGDDIWLAAGIYRPDGGTASRGATFTIPNGVTLRGGFIGVESDPASRPPSGPATILSGEIGDPGTTLDNSRHVLRMEAFFGSALIERVTITGGRADGSGADGEGGGARVRLSDVTFESCRFVDNWALEGGGLFSTSGVPTLRDCVFESNFADLEGGGARLEDFAIVERCLFVGNTAGFGGGLVTCCGDAQFTEIRVVDCDFISNFADFGGGLFIPNGFMRARGCRFVDNGASRGGAVYNTSADGVFVNCFMGGGFADLGAAIYNSGAAHLVNTVLVRNAALTSGGGAYSTGPLTLSNCTVYGNVCLFNTSSGGLHSVGGPLTVRNTILWSNTNGVGGDETAQVRIVSGTYAFEYSVIEAWTGQLVSQGCFSLSPAFVAPSGDDGVLGSLDDDFRLLPESPCIDAGFNDLVAPDQTDVDDDGDVLEATPLDRAGIDRFLDDPLSPDVGVGLTPIVDIGAHEYEPPCLGDLNDDGVINFEDLNLVLSNWGAMSVPGEGGDVDGDGQVNFNDINVLLITWGTTCD